MQIINDVQQRQAIKNTFKKPSEDQCDLFSQMLRYQNKTATGTETTGAENLKILTKSEISLSYPPSVESKGLEALTPEIMAGLKEKYDFQNMGRNSREFEELLYELKRLEVISERDVQDMLLGEPMSFDEKGQPTSWLNYVGKGQDGQENGLADDDSYGFSMDFDTMILKWLKELAETGKINFDKLTEQGDGESSMAKLYQKKSAVCEKLSDIIEKLMTTDENNGTGKYISPISRNGGNI